eukprot:GFUD01009675.1.p1 GENE.GFUD01009675.1~~GFUD01009675.1.p1  ORF type:complete len:145 (-),score=53.60 GFUD01009675.1:1830-2264(-)
MREKLVTSAGSVPGVEHALLDRQLSSDSTMFENPFRAGGQLSEDAANIIDALKTGKLDEVTGESQENGHQQPAADTTKHGDENLKNEISNVKTQSDKRNEAESETNAKEVEVERGLVINPKHVDVEHVVIPEEKKKGCVCCVLL